MKENPVIILIGHGGVPTDFPRPGLRELMRLEGERNARGLPSPSDRERELDLRIRTWPRTSESDPYRAGLEEVAARLRNRLPDRRVVVAYNEFCAPSVDDAVDAEIEAGARTIDLLTTMFTPGGSHTEKEIPAAVERARLRHPGVEIRYAWPFDLELAADLLARQLETLPPR